MEGVSGRPGRGRGLEQWVGRDTGGPLLARCPVTASDVYVYLPQGPSVAGGLCGRLEVRELPFILLGIDEGVEFRKERGLYSPRMHGSGDFTRLHQIRVTRLV